MIRNLVDVDDASPATAPEILPDACGSSLARRLKFFIVDGDGVDGACSHWWLS
jgi:hypothetical protein